MHLENCSTHFHYSNALASIVLPLTLEFAFLSEKILEISRGIAQEKYACALHIFK